MSKQSENKEKQGFQKKGPCCANRCAIGGFAISKSNWCREHTFKS